jgi:hypothetical protein
MDGSFWHSHTLTLLQQVLKRGVILDSPLLWLCFITIFHKDHIISTLVRTVCSSPCTTVSAFSYPGGIFLGSPWLFCKERGAAEEHVALTARLPNAYIVVSLV